jgi:hypothetical protein
MKSIRQAEVELHLVAARPLSKHARIAGEWVNSARSETARDRALRVEHHPVTERAARDEPRLPACSLVALSLVTIHSPTGGGRVVRQALGVRAVARDTFTAHQRGSFPRTRRALRADDVAIAPRNDPRSPTPPSLREVLDA